MEKKKVTVLVAGQRFTLITEESEKYVTDIASKIDAKITSLSLSQSMSRERAAVLTALDLADDAEQDKKSIREIREQIKDYVMKIESLSDENAALKAQISRLQLDKQSGEDAQKLIAEGEKEKAALRNEITALKEQIALIEAEKPVQPPVAEEPVKEEKAQGEEKTEPVAKEESAAVSAEDDLFFDLPPAAPTIKPQKEKKRHEHQHVNPYKQQFLQKQNEQKGYTQQRQYSFFDKNE